MIAPLRARHRRVIAVLAVALPVCFAAAIASRAPEPVGMTLPEELLGHDAAEFVVREALSDARAGREYELRGSDDRSAFTVAQTAGEPAPDVLIYATSARDSLDELPADARFIAPLERGERRFGRPADAAAIVLFSLAHGEVVARFELEGR